MKRTYNFGSDQVESIEKLAGELGIDKTDVLTNGLRLLRLAVREARAGHRIGVVVGPAFNEFVGVWNDVKPTTAA